MSSAISQPSTAAVLATELAHRRVGQLGWSFGTVELIGGDQSLWLKVLVKGKAGFALRCGFVVGDEVQTVSRDGDEYYVHYRTATVRVVPTIEDESLFRVQVFLTPRQGLILPFIPRDLYPLGDGDSPDNVAGAVHTSQTGLAAPIVYWSLTAPASGTFLYLQNYTALNPYFQIVGESPADRVGGTWPELGYLPPTSETHPLPAKEEICVSDVFIVFSKGIDLDIMPLCRNFVKSLASIYTHLELPNTNIKDWTGLASKALKDLESAKSAHVTAWNNLYLHPYNEAEYPDSAVQLNVTHGLEDYGTWLGKRIPFRDELFKGVSRFYDPDLKTIRRYLPNVGKDKDRDEVDSWYMYHPLMTLARLAKAGDMEARKLFFDSLETGIRFARKFRYKWPVLFNLVTEEITRAERREGEPGQVDVAGLYAYVMMQAFELTEEQRYVQEAEKAIKAAVGFGFELAYQTNITAWGIAACAWLYEATSNPYFLDAAEVFAAAFLRLSITWESELGFAKHYPIFFGTLCLDTAPYMAIFECHESFEALEKLSRKHRTVFRNPCACC